MHRDHLNSTISLSNRNVTTDNRHDGDTFSSLVEWLCAAAKLMIPYLQQEIKVFLHEYLGLLNILSQNIPWPINKLRLSL